MSASSDGKRVSVVVVATTEERTAALAVIDEVFREEKGWLATAEAEIPALPAATPNLVWLLARVGGEPVGVLRLLVDPPIDLPEHFGVRFEAGVDAARLARLGRFAEVGRLMVRRAWRGQPRVVLALMRAALGEGLERGAVQFLTTVFENDPHSPLRFHERHLGFERIGWHERGELACGGRRILLRLDLQSAYERLGRRGGVAAELARGLEARLLGLRERAPAGRRPLAPVAST